MSHVAKGSSDECWLWTAFRTSRGYGHFRHTGTHEIASHAAYRLLIGPIPDGMDVMHSCDNPPCVNPAHLSIGTRRQNMHDARVRRRLVVGDQHWNSKLTTEQVEFARTSSLSTHKAAKVLGISQSHVCNIRLGKRRTAIEGGVP
jgi:hypothetical protein